MNSKIIIIGCGKMGAALMRRIKDSGGYRIEGVEKSESRASEVSGDLGVDIFTDVSAASEGDIYIIAVKPQDMGKTVRSLKEVLKNTHERKIVISIAAGITTDYLRKNINREGCSVIRVMPNTPAMRGEGVTRQGGY